MRTAAFSVLIGLCALVTYLTRYPPLLLGRRLRPSPRIARSFRYIPIGIFAAMVAPAVVWRAPVNGHPDFAFYAAAAVALVTAVVSRKPLWAMVAGVLTIAIWHTVA